MHYVFQLSAILLLQLNFIQGYFDECSPPKNLIFHSQGNVSISGFFDIHKGDNCTNSNGKELEEAAALVWTISVLNHHNYIPGLKIGLSIYDGCSLPDEVKKTYVQAMVYENCMSDNEKVVGIIASQSIKRSLEPLTYGLNTTVVEIGPLLEQTFIIDMVEEFLRELPANTIHRIIAEDMSWLRAFGKAMANEGLCVYDQVLVDEIHSVNNEDLEPPDDTNESVLTKGSPLIVVLASSVSIDRLMHTLDERIRNKTDIFWLLVPIDSFLEIEPDLLPPTSYTLSAVLPKVDVLENFLKQNEVTMDPFNHRETLKSPFFLNSASKIIKMLLPVKQMHFKYCGETNDTCEEFDDYLDSVSLTSGSNSLFMNANDISNVLDAARIPIEPEMFLFNVARKESFDDFAVFTIYNKETSTLKPVLQFIREERRKRGIVRLHIEDIVNRNNGTTTERTKGETPVDFQQNPDGKHPCYESAGNISNECGICVNFVQYLAVVAQEKQTDFDDITIHWRYDTWVGVNAAIASIGIMCCVAIFIFISVRICAGDVLEGSPVLSFFLLLATILTYAATIPFSFQSSGVTGNKTLATIICDLRVFAPPVANSMLLSLIFCRSLMLAASDQDGGFMSHVNGYLQAVLIFFVNGVQFVISGEFWFFNSFLLASATTCQSMYENHRFIILHSYDFFLLFLTLLVIPFMFKLKRNYKEGTFFSFAIIIVLCVWCTWITLLYFLPHTYNDAIVTFSLTATASTIVICIFIPRTYLMTTSIVRDRIVNTLPPLSHSSNFNSSQALYDSVNLTSKVGNNNPNFYTVNPTDSLPATPDIRPGEYYSSQTQIKIPTPTRINPGNSPLAHCQTPEHTYEGCESPYHGPKNVTRF